MNLIQTLLRHLGTAPAQQDVNAVLGTPKTFGETTLVPVSEMMIGFELGAAPDSSCCDESESGCCDPTVREDAESYAHTRRIATIEVGPEGVRVHPSVDSQRITLAAVALSLWLLGCIGLTLNTLLDRDA